MMNTTELTAFLETHFDDDTIYSPMEAVEELTTDYETFSTVFDWLMVNGHDKLAEIYANHSFPEHYDQYIKENDLEEE